MMITAGALFAGDKYYSSPFAWYSPEIMAQGGSFMANAQGYNALLTNPAAFAKYREKERKNGEVKRKGELTILSTNMSFSGDIFSFMEDYRNGTEETPMIEMVLNQVTSNGMGAGVQIGTGYVGRGVGIGLMSVVEGDFPQAETTLGLTGDITMTTGLVAGYAHPFNLGPVKLVVGGDIRPMYRMSIPGIDISSFLGSVSGDSDGGSGDISFTDVDAMAGLGVGFDAGADVIWRDLTFSLVMRDIGNTRYFYKPLPTLAGLEFSGAEIEDTYITPWTLNFGLAYHPVMGKLNKFIDTTVHGAFTQPLVFEDNLIGYDSQSFWTRLDLGAEVVLLSSVALRAGLQGGYFTAGFGLDLFFLELNGALYSEELGSHAGDQPKMGGSLEFAIRF